MRCSYGLSVLHSVITGETRANLPTDQVRKLNPIATGHLRFPAFQAVLLFHFTLLLAHCDM